MRDAGHETRAARRFVCADEVRIVDQVLEVLTRASRLAYSVFVEICGIVVAAHNDAFDGGLGEHAQDLVVVLRLLVD